MIFPKTATPVKSMRGMGGCYVGRRGMPMAWIETMYADYQAGLSLAQVAKKYGRTRQSIFDIFKRRGLKLRERNFQPVIEYKGRRYTCQKTGGRHRYLRDTRAGRTGANRQTIYLHHVVWQEHFGPVPAGHKVVFKDGNHLNCDIANLELLTNSEQVKRHATGANQFSIVASARLTALLGGHGNTLTKLKL
jgi:hypothetical protein